MTNLIIAETGKIHVTGELSFATVVALWQHGQSLIVKQPQLCFDLSAVSHSDSAGLVLLLAWYRKAYHLGKIIQFINIPKQILAMARVTELEQILPLANSPKEHLG